MRPPSVKSSLSPLRSQTALPRGANDGDARRECPWRTVRRRGAPRRARRLIARPLRHYIDVMKYRQIPRTGLFVSELCLGAMTFGGSDGVWGSIGNLDQKGVDELVHGSWQSSGWPP